MFFLSFDFCKINLINKQRFFCQSNFFILGFFKNRLTVVRITEIIFTKYTHSQQEEVVIYNIPQDTERQLTAERDFWTAVQKRFSLLLFCFLVFLLSNIYISLIFGSPLLFLVWSVSGATQVSTYSKQIRDNRLSVPLLSG